MHTLQVLLVIKIFFFIILDLSLGQNPRLFIQHIDQFNYELKIRLN